MDINRAMGFSRRAAIASGMPAEEMRADMKKKGRRDGRIIPAHNERAFFTASAAESGSRIKSMSRNEGHMNFGMQRIYFPIIFPSLF